MYPFYTCAASGRASYLTAVSWPSRIKGAVIHDPTIVSEPATGLHRPPRAVKAEQLAVEAEAFYRLRRAVIRRAGGEPAAALRSAFAALAFSVRTNAATLAVPVRVVCEDRHQRALWGLVRRHARLGEPLAFSDTASTLTVVSGDEELGYFLPADQAWVSVIRGFSATPYVGRVVGVEGHRLALETVVGHVGLAVAERRAALHVHPRASGDGEATASPEAPAFSMPA